MQFECTFHPPALQLMVADPRQMWPLALSILRASGSGSTRCPAPNRTGTNRRQHQCCQQLRPAAPMQHEDAGGAHTRGAATAVVAFGDDLQLDRRRLSEKAAPQPWTKMWLTTTRQSARLSTILDAAEHFRACLVSQAQQARGGSPGIPARSSSCTAIRQQAGRLVAASASSAQSLLLPPARALATPFVPS